MRRRKTSGIRAIASSVRFYRVFPSKVKLLLMTRGRCVVRRPCAGDGPQTYVKPHLDYNRKIFQLILQ